MTVDLPTLSVNGLTESASADRQGEAPPAAGGQSVAHIDTGRPGRGGDLGARTPALNLADRDDQMRLSPDLLNHLALDQLQRLHVGRVRQSWEDRRSTTHPAELSLVITGAGSVLERRPSAAREPSRGTALPRPPSAQGGEVGPAPADDESDDAARPGTMRLGSHDAAPGEGIARAPVGLDHRVSAPIGSARPDVAKAAVAVPAVDQSRPKDNVDSDQEVATTVRSLVHASSAGGTPGEGQGGSGPGTPAAAGGEKGAGSRSRPLGTGDGANDEGARDSRLTSYYRQINAKIFPLWADAFPKSALLDLKQGTVILEFVVFADGRTSVSWPPVRPSGIDEFDRNCADAIRRASPLPPIPPALGARSLRIRWPFVAANPIVK